MSKRGNMLVHVLRRLSAAEDGFTIVFALALLTIGIAVGAAALADTLASRSHANLDTRQRRALQAADFGVQAMLYRVNQVNVDSFDLEGGENGIGNQAICVVRKPSGEWVTEPPTKGVCPKVEQEIGNHDSFQAEFIPNEKVKGTSAIAFIEPKIVAIGIDDNGNAADPNRRVVARVSAGLSSLEPFKTIEANNNLTFRVPLAETFNGTARAGNSVAFKGESALAHTFTGVNITLGGKFVTSAKIEAGCKKDEFETGLLGPNVVLVPASMVEVLKPPQCKEHYFTRPPVPVPAGKLNCPSGCAGLAGAETTGKAGERINIKAGETLVLAPGNDYVFCSLGTNGPIELAAGTTNASLPVRVFIDDPRSARCEGSAAFKVPVTAGVEQEVKAGSFYAGQGVGGRVGGVAQTLSPTQVQIYITGAGQNNNDSTEFISTSSAANAFFLYAPTSLVNASAFSFAGGVVGYDVIEYATLFTQNIGLNSYPLSNSYGVFHVAGYTQCSPAFPEALAKAGGLTTNAATDLAGC